MFIYSNDVLVIKGDNEILIPYIFGESVKNVIIEENKIIIDKIYCEYWNETNIRNINISWTN